MKFSYRKWFPLKQTDPKRKIMVIRKDIKIKLRKKSKYVNIYILISIFAKTSVIKYALYVVRHNKSLFKSSDWIYWHKGKE